MSRHTISAPATGVSQTVNISAGDRLDFSFDTATAMFERTGPDLAIKFNDGTAILLEDFFVTGGENTSLPALKLPDGTEISAGDFLKSFDPNFDISTAAGPSGAKQLQSGGSGDYSDNSGALVAGVEKLGSLGTDYWNRSTTETELHFSGFGPDQAEPGQTAPVTDPETNFNFHTRLVVTSTSGNTFTFSAVGPDGMPVTGVMLEALFTDGSIYFEILSIDPLTSTITVGLTTEGLAALASGDYASDLLTVIVNGDRYEMPLVVNDGPSYNYVPEEAKPETPDTPLMAEWYSLDGRGLPGNSSVVLGGEAYNQVDIASTGNGYRYGAYNSTIDITAGKEGRINISAETGDNQAIGLYASSGTVSLKGGNGDVNVKSKASVGPAYGVYNTGSGSAVTVSGRDVTLNSLSNNFALGVYSTGSGSVNLNASGKLSITAESTNTNQGTNDVKGAYAYNGSTVNLQGREVEIVGKSANSGAYTLFSQGRNSVINVTAGEDGLLKVSADAGKVGFGNGYGQITNAALVAHDHGVINLNGNNIAVSATGGGNTGNSYGIATLANGKANINGLLDSRNTMSFSATGANTAMGIFSEAGTVDVTAGNLNDLITASGTTNNGYMGIGIYAGAGSRVTLKGGEGDDTLRIDATMNGNAAINPGDRFDNTNGGSGAYGLVAAWGGAQALVDGFETVEINATSTGAGGSAYGMFAQEGYYGLGVGATIQNDSAITVTITATALDPARAFAMYTNWGGLNSIIGGSRAGDETGDMITLNGHIYSHGGKNAVTTGFGDDVLAIEGNVTTGGSGNNVFTLQDGDDLVSITGYMGGAGKNIIDTGRGDDTVEIMNGLAATGGGLNSILTGEGDDVVHIGGDISGNNAIATGGGNDVIRLDGAVGGSALDLDGGDGYDTLVLSAGSLQDFLDKYDGFLSAFGGMNIEAVHVSLDGSTLSQADLDGIRSYFQNPAFSGTSVSYTVGDTLMTDGFLAEGGSQTFNLADILDIIDKDDVTSVDMRGENSNNMHIGSTLGDSMSHLKIDGDAGSDTVTLDSAWQQNGANGDYVLYQNGGDTLEIHQDILVAFGG